MHWSYILNFFMQVVNWADGHSTFILVIITVIYAYFTYKMAKIMSKQIVADIKISNIVLGSDLAEEWFKRRVKETSQEINHSCLNCRLLFDARNKGAGNGSIDKPTLILKFKNDDFEIEIEPKTKSYKSYKSSLAENIIETDVSDSGGVIFLRGGEAFKVELEYVLCDLDPSSLKHIKEELDSLEYYIRYINNIGKTHFIRINSIKSHSEVSRG